MKRTSEIDRYGLYGEVAGVITPEFVHVETISARSSLHDWTIAPHAHNGIFQVLLIREGDALLAADGCEFQLVAPCLVIMPCGCAHAFRFAPDTQGWVLSVADSLLVDPRIAPLGIGGFARRGAALRLPLTGAGEVEAVLSGLFAGISRRLSQTPGRLSAATVAMIALLLATTDEVVAERAEAETALPDRRIDLVRRFSALVEQHYREHWSVARYASELNTTTPTLTRACRAIAVRAPGDMTLDRLLLEAMRALTYTAAGVAQIAHDLGFSDPAYFARFFKARAGMTASAFRSERAWLGATP